MINLQVDGKFCQCWHKLGFFLIIVLLLSGCAGLLQPETVETEQREDVALAMKIKSKLIESNDLSAAAIHVEALSGVVELTGFVETVSERQLAGQVAQQTEGVVRVNNLLEVK